MLKAIQGAALFFLMLVVGVFWGNYFSFSRSYDVFSLEELIHIAKTVVNNLAVPMRFIAMTCILLMGLSAYLLPDKKSTEFYLTLASICCIIISLIITVSIEVPINNQIIRWTSSTAPENWQEIRNRWQVFNSIRTVIAVLSFILFIFAILKPLDSKKPF